MNERRDTVIGFGPVGPRGLGTTRARRAHEAPVRRAPRLAAVVADVTVAELGGFKAMNESRSDVADDAGCSAWSVAVDPTV